MDNINEVVKHFSFKGDYVSHKIFGSGHINTTYLVEYRKNDGSIQKYILQKINKTIFKNMDALMQNIFSVTSFLRSKIKECGGDSDRETLHFIRTVDDKQYYSSPDGNYYRAYIFVSDSVSHDAAADAEMFGKSGIAFGRFQKLLSDFPADTLSETIPNFHNTFWRYENEFLPALKLNSSNRADSVLDLIEFVNARRDDMPVLIDLMNKGDIPLRVTHNDTKLNNVMFDADTQDAICVIDLDTVMPGLAHYDFGDSIRFGANTAEEDEKELNKVSLDLDYFEAYAKGFLSQAGDSLNKCEIEHLAFSAKMMTFECGMRFLTDYLNGDVYFKTAYPEHNLVRAKNQFKLVSDMENKMDKMNSIIQSI